MKLSDIHPNPDNPRTISDLRLKQLRESLDRNPKFLEKRPIIIDENNMIVAGNQRFRALSELGYDEIPDKWVDRVENWTPDEIAEFVIMDNVPFGSWDWDVMDTKYDMPTVKSWGVDVPMAYTEPVDVSTVDEFTESFNFIIKCDDRDSLRELQTLLDSSGKVISYKKFIQLYANRNR